DQYSTSFRRSEQTQHLGQENKYYLQPGMTRYQISGVYRERCGTSSTFLASKRNGGLACQKRNKNGNLLKIPAPKSHLKNILHKIAINKWQHEWTTGETGGPVFNIIPKV
ncbi:hypothetical protein AVEN_35866-1, partial [Araneus ventricosus]